MSNTPDYGGQYEPPTFGYPQQYRQPFRPWTNPLVRALHDDAGKPLGISDMPAINRVIRSMMGGATEPPKPNPLQARRLTKPEKRTRDLLGPTAGRRHEPPERLHAPLSPPPDLEAAAAAVEAEAAAAAERKRKAAERSRRYRRHMGARPR